MALSRDELHELLRLLVETQDTELNCEQCLAAVAEFAERQLVGHTIPAGLQAIEQHLSVCAECRDEYEALRRTLSEMTERADDSLPGNSSADQR